MFRINLTDPQRLELESALRATPDRRLHERVQAVLMTSRGRARDEVAADLGVCPRTVRRHLAAYAAGGLDALRPRASPGRPPRLTGPLADDLRAWVIAGPIACGRPLANWTYAALAEHLARARGVRVRRSALHAFCRRRGIRPCRPTYRYLRGDPARQAVAAGELAGLKRGRPTAG